MNRGRCSRVRRGVVPALCLARTQREAGERMLAEVVVVTSVPMLCLVRTQREAGGRVLAVEWWRSERMR